MPLSRTVANWSGKYLSSIVTMGARLARHVWHGMDQTIIDSAIDKWRGRLRTCVLAKGGHFEQMLWHLLRRLSFSSVAINVSFVTLCQYHIRFTGFIYVKFEL